MMYWIFAGGFITGVLVTLAVIAVYAAGMAD